MSAKRSLLAVIMLLLVSAGTPAEDKRDVEDLLRFFPDYDYRNIIYRNYESMKNAPTYELYEKRNDRISDIWAVGERTHSEFYTRFTSEIVSLTLAIVSEDTTIRRKAEYIDDLKKHNEYSEKLRKEFPGLNSIRYETVGEGADRSTIAVITVSKRETLRVYGLAAPDDFCKWAVEKDYFQALDKKLMDRPVWKHVVEANGQEYITYYYAELTGELLICTDLDYLEEMVETGAGLRPSFLENELYSDLLHFLPELGQTWSVSDLQARYNNQDEEQLRKMGMTEEQIKRRLESYKMRPVLAVNSTALDSNITEINIIRYTEEQWAQQALEREGQMPDFSRIKMPAEYVESLKKQRIAEQKYKKSEVYGEYLISRTVQSPEVYKAKLEMMREQKKMQEQWEKEQAEKKESK